MESGVSVKKMEKPHYMNIVYFAAKVLFAMLTLCELYYFSAFLTDSALLSAGLVAVILSVTSTVDLIVSFFLGTIMEIIHLPWGKYRSWLLICPPLVTITHIFMFSKIGSNDTVSAVIIVAGFIISHLFWSIGEAALNAMPLVMTDDLQQRAGLSVWGGRGSMANTLIFGFLAAPLIGFFNRTTGSSVLGYCLTGVVFSIIYWIGFWWLYHETKDCEETSKDVANSSKKRETNLLPAVKSVFTNRHLIAMIIDIACTFCYMILQSSSMYYFFTYALGGGSLFGYMGMFISSISIVKLVGSILVPWYLKIFKGNKRYVYLLGFIGYAIFSLIAYVINASPVVTLALILIGHFFGCTSLAMQLGLFQDCAVYSEYKSGKDVKGFVMALMNMPVKIGILIKNSLISSTLVGIGYSAVATDTSAYGPAFYKLFLFTPAIICIIAVVANLVLYGLNEEKVKEMQAEIKARKVAKAA